MTVEELIAQLQHHDGRMEVVLAMKPANPGDWPAGTLAVHNIAVILEGRLAPHHDPERLETSNLTVTKPERTPNAVGLVIQWR